MSLTNAFAIGACQVRVTHTVQTLWQGTLAPGQASPQFAGHLNTELLQAIANNDGTVELDWISGAGPADDYVVSVIPSYSITSATQIVVEQINMPNGTTGACASSTIASRSGLSLTGSGSAWTPDPADVTATGNKSGLALYMGAVV